MTYDEYLDKRRKDEDCGDPIREEGWFDFAGARFEAPDMRGVLKGWICDIWARGYKRGFCRGFDEGQTVKP